jgi:hypothetical protein
METTTHKPTGRRLLASLALSLLAAFLTAGAIATVLHGDFWSILVAGVAGSLGAVGAGAIARRRADGRR